MVKIKKGEEVIEVSEEEAKKLVDSKEASLVDVAVASKNEALDDKGVPWKNRFAESSRKLNDSQKEIEALKEQVASQPVQPVVQDTEDEWKGDARKIAREEYQKELLANSVMNNTLNSLEANVKTGVMVKKYRAEIEAQILPLSSSLRNNPETAKRISRMVLGQHLEDAEPVPVAQPNVKLTPLQTSSSANPTNVVTTSELTVEEDEFAEKRGYFDKDYTNAEIKERYKKAQDRKKK